MNEYLQMQKKSMVGVGQNIEVFKKVATHTMLMFAAMNLKKLATWLCKAKKPMAFYFKFL
ncbi:Transposase, IS4 [Enterococcus mundtii 1A]|nr:hypothetical protein AK89_04285 [Enterococcus mundtii CRL35]MDA9429545.1 Transposase, IS4 [Enterococcus mundtii 1A]